MVAPVVVSRIQHRRGLQEQFNGTNAIYPKDYNGIGGYGSSVDFTPEKYPNVLLPGEMVLCTDTRRVYMGNINGEYLQLAIQV